ncbi:peptidoglycan recognition family protein [Muricomes intestini]|uniref:peptidoglycan recognition protein family protein n=1 Tax=Muricomes intestini TaxID=1796634 RepID=UPI002FDD6487
MSKNTSQKQMRKREFTKRRRITKRWLKVHKDSLWIYGGIIVLAIVTIVMGIYSCAAGGRGKNTGLEADASKPAIDVQLLDVNEYSRPGIKSDSITGIVIHYTANPGSTAQENRDYFNGLKDSHETSASSHFVVGLEGEIIQCVPTWELAYASNGRNHDTVSIESCHPDESGKFTDETYKSLVQLTAWLCRKYGLTEQEVIRHYDVTGKNCPKYFVENEEAWELFRGDVEAALEKA